MSQGHSEPTLPTFPLVDKARPACSRVGRAGSMADVVTRLYFMRLRRLTNEALAQGGVTPELTHARQEHVPTFTHFLDIPMLFLIVSLGAIKPSTWTQFIIGAFGALAMATVLTLWIPRLYPWVPPTYHKPS